MVVTKFLDKTRPNENGDEDLRVLRHAYLNSYFQTGYKNLMDLAIIHKTEEEEATDPQLLDLSENYVKVDEIPFDLPVAD